MLDFTLILPAFNEAAQIEQTLKEAIAYLERAQRSFEIIVAADGTDGTREIVARRGSCDPRLRVIGSNERRGKGRGVRDAVAIAQGRIIGFADADNKVPIDELDKFFFAFDQGHQVVIGSRALEKSRIEREQPVYRRVGSRVFTICLHVSVGVFASDTQCGFKFFTCRAAKAIFDRQRIDGYMFDVELLAIARELGYKPHELPVRWRDDGDSRLLLFSGTIQNTIDLVRIRWYLSGYKSALPSSKDAAQGARD